jgi:hypothetical protein
MKTAATKVATEVATIAIDIGFFFKYYFQELFMRKTLIDGISDELEEPEVKYHEIDGLYYTSDDHVKPYRIFEVVVCGDKVALDYIAEDGGVARMTVGSFRILLEIGAFKPLAIYEEKC